MHSLTIVFGPSPVPWVLLFKTEEAAQKAWTSDNDLLCFTDDFGQTVSIQRTSIHGMMLEDMEQSKLAHIEQGLHRARTQAKAQQIAQSDPTLRTAAMMGGMAGGPAMMTPAFNGRG